jgi:hypothetical protein
MALPLLSSLFAFCGFYVGGAKAEMYNNATEVVLMRQGTTTVLSMQNNYQGPPAGFALVVPVPTVIKQDQVKTLPREIFDKVDTLGAPRLVEYWEQDPCNAPRYGLTSDSILRAEVASAGEADDDERPKKDYKVHVEARFSVGEYDIEVLSAKASTGLQAWLVDHHYSIPANAEPLLRPYIEQGMKWFVAKVDPRKVAFKAGMATLSPLRFSYDSQDFTLPIRLGLANSSGTQDLIVNVLAPNNTRYEVANYPNITIPTNLPVNDTVRTRFGEFYAALFDHALAQRPGAVVTEYSWDASSCDPCPGPTLDGNDLQTFGADVLGARYQDAAGYTLTRLHARYGTEVKDDLSFRAVEPIAGGRGLPDAHGEMSSKVTNEGVNNFQGRYVILHPWEGPVSCQAPNRGRWGGPASAQAVAATNLAFAPRGKVELASLLAKDVPEVGLLSSKTAPPPIAVRQQQGCGCNTGQTSEAGETGVEAVIGFAAVGVVLRRRRRV